ncbi:hypothetical protein [Mycoplasma hafezii]|uniref:hypothetical protein n=1 Tax=Mycoplasma hafezii TaxID=525886 RepID=UPI003CEA3887
MKYKLKKTFLALTLTMSAAPLLFGAKIESSIKQTHKAELLDFLNENHKEFIKENQEKINESFLKLKNFEDIETLIDNLDEYTSDKSFINYIDNLNVDLFTKKVLVIEFKRFQKRENIKNREIKTGQTWYKVDFTNKSKTTNILGDFDVKINDRSIKYNGFDVFKITDNVFAQDVSYIGWSNQTLITTLLGRYFESDKYQEDLEKAIAISNSDINSLEFNFTQILKSQFSNNNYIHNFLTRNKFTLTSEIGKYSKTKDVSQLWKVLKVLKSTKFEEIQKSGNILNYLKNTFKNQWETIKSNPQVKLLLSEISDMKNLVGKALSQRWFVQFKSVVSKSLLALSAAFCAKSLFELFLSIDNEYVNTKLIYDCIINGTNFLIGALSVAGASIPIAGSIIAITTLVCDILLKSIPLGNGYTIYENFNDQGLNDWEFQWKNNHKNMISIASKYSNGFKNGIVWKVTDGWFTYPDIYIATSKGNGLNNEYENYSYTWLSPGNEFNFGNKIIEK